MGVLFLWETFSGDEIGKVLYVTILWSMCIWPLYLMAIHQALIDVKETILEVSIAWLVGWILSVIAFKFFPEAVGRFLDRF